MITARTPVLARHLSPSVRSQLFTRDRPSRAYSFKFYMPGGNKLIEGLQRWIGNCNDGDINGFIPFKIDGTTVGYVAQTTADRLTSVQDSVFKVSFGPPRIVMPLLP